MKRNCFLLKVFTIICMVFLLIIMPSCKEKSIYSKIDQVSYENILSCTDYKYIVICWQVDCTNCDKLKDAVEEYYAYQKKHKEAPKLYGLNVNLSYNKNIVGSSVDEYVNAVGTYDYKDIKAITTPTILYIENGMLVKNISYPNTKYPVTEGKNFLKSLMN